MRISTSSSSARNNGQHSHYQPLFIPASQLASNSTGKYRRVRLETLELDRIPTLFFEAQSRARIGGLKPHDLVVLYGSRHTLKLSHFLAVRAQLPLHEYGLNSNVLFIDAGCSFNSHEVSSLTQTSKLLPRDALEGIRLSRAFTVYQLSSLIYGWLPDAIRDHDARLAIISAPLNLFADLDIPREELVTSFNRLSRFLSTLAAKEEAVILVTVPSPCDSPKKGNLLRLLKSRANIIMKLEEKRGHPKLILERYLRKNREPTAIPLSPLNQEAVLEDFLRRTKNG